MSNESEELSFRQLFAIFLGLTGRAMQEDSGLLDEGPRRGVIGYITYRPPKEESLRSLTLGLRDAEELVDVIWIPRPEGVSMVFYEGQVSIWRESDGTIILSSYGLTTRILPSASPL